MQKIKVSKDSQDQNRNSSSKEVIENLRVDVRDVKLKLEKLNDEVA